MCVTRRTVVAVRHRRGVEQIIIFLLFSATRLAINPIDLYDFPTTADCIQRALRVHARIYIYTYICLCGVPNMNGARNALYRTQFSGLFLFFVSNPIKIILRDILYTHTHTDDVYHTRKYRKIYILCICVCVCV